MDVNWRKRKEEPEKNLNHPDIEWELQSIPRLGGYFVYKKALFDYVWTVVHVPSGRRLSEKIEGSENFNHHKTAMTAINEAAIYLLSSAISERRFRPCVLCDEPSLLGEPTCSPAHATALAKARAELSWT